VSIAAIILAAGASRRLGRSKQDVVVAGETLLHRAVRVAHEAPLSPVIVVAHPRAEYPNSFESGSDLIIAVNPETDEGIASSIRCGVSVASTQGVAGAVILTCDQPALRAGHLLALVEDENRIAGSAYTGSIGVPAYFPAAIFPLLLQLHGDTGARKLLVNSHAIPAEELTFDIDTDDDLAAARAFLEPEER